MRILVFAAALIFSCSAVPTVDGGSGGGGDSIGGGGGTTLGGGNGGGATGGAGGGGSGSAGGDGSIGGGGGAVGGGTGGGATGGGGGAVGGGTGGGAVGGGGGGGAVGGGGGSVGGGTGGGGATTDGGVDAGVCVPPTVGRGLAWVRSNPMFISALSVVMGPPPATAVNEYFTDFHANAVHLWQTGLPTEIAGWADAGTPNFRYLSWVDLNGNSSANGALLGGAAPLAGRIGYQIGDEPMDSAQLLTMQTGAAAVRGADPTGLTVLNLSPDGAKGALATQGAAMAEFDVLSLDDYTYRRGAYQSLSGVRTAALTNGKPYWRYLDGFRFTTQSETTTESDMRWDAYVGAVWGFTGHTWFIYQIDPSNPDLVPSFFTVKGQYGSPRSTMFQWAAALNQQLASLGRSLTQLRSTDVRYVASLLQPAGTSGFTRGAGGDPYLTRVSPPSGTFADSALGFFVDDCGEHYVMVQSQRHQDADFPNSSQSSTTFKVEVDFSGATDPTLDRTALLVLDPVTDTVSSRPLTSTGANTASLDLVLPAGGAMLFKYKNGRAFVRQP